MARPTRPRRPPGLRRDALVQPSPPLGAARGVLVSLSLGAAFWLAVVAAGLLVR